MTQITQPPNRLDADRDRRARRSRENQVEVADIGEIPPVKNPERREACRLNQELFLTTYFPHSTGLTPFSDDHRLVISRNQIACLEVARVCNVVYRGFAKTTISENTAIHATLYGHRKYVPIFGADASGAARIIDSIKMELETNDLLYEDFPEVCHAIRALEGKPQRQHSQHHGGNRTFIEWTADAVVLPTIEGSVASGAILTAHGLTAAARGMKYKRADGSNARPDLVILDDFQTDESAASPLQVEKRLSIIRKSILRMGSHRSAISVICNGTIIEPDDGIDQLSTPRLNPSWQSVRIPMIRTWAKRHDDLWLTEYAKIRCDYDPDDPYDQMRAHRDANAFYTEHRAEMDEGCVVSWESCYDVDKELSAIQHAYNILIDDGAAVFASECQNAPVAGAEAGEVKELRATEVAKRTNGRLRGVVPLDATKLTAFVDVQHSLLFYVVVAWREDFTGYVVDYGTYPEQPRRYFALREAPKKLADAFPGAESPAAVHAALRKLEAELLKRKWSREDGETQTIDLLLVDWNDGTMKKEIAAACRLSSRSANIMPAGGVGIRPGDTQMAQFKLRENEQRGEHFIIERNYEHHVKAVKADVNHWKSHVANALLAHKGNSGAISLYGNAGEDHRLFADHCAAEKRRAETDDKTQRKGEVWKCPPGRENHFFDCLVGCAVAAAVRGCAKGIKAIRPRGKQPKKRRRGCVTPLE